MFCNYYLGKNTHFFEMSALESKRNVVILKCKYLKYKCLNFQKFVMPSKVDFLAEICHIFAIENFKS